MITFIAVLAVAVVGHICKAGYVPPAKYCLPDSGLEELSGCVVMDRLSEMCKARGTRDEKIECFCVEEMLMSYFDCKADVYKCLRTNMLDSFFDEDIKQWHEGCDQYRGTSTITTPPEPTLTATYDLRACDRLASSCFRGDYETNLCSRSWLPESTVSYVSCICQPPIYSLVSECYYNGNVSCKATAAYETNLPGYKECPYFWPGSETLPPVDMTSFLSLTAHGMKPSAAPLLVPVAQATLTTIIQTATTEPGSMGEL